MTRDYFCQIDTDLIHPLDASRQRSRAERRGDLRWQVNACGDGGEDRAARRHQTDRRRVVESEAMDRQDGAAALPACSGVTPVRNALAPAARSVKSPGCGAASVKINMYQVPGAAEGTSTDWLAEAGLLKRC